MIKLMLTTVASSALVLTAAAANPPEATTSATAPTPKYQPVEAETPITPVAVTTKEDAAKLADWQFAVADVNADGSIDEEEFAAFVAASAEESAGLPGAPDEKSEPASKAFEMIAKSDKKITKAELVDARSKSFDKADADGDKALDALEQQRFAALIAAKPDKTDKTQ
ncbi:MAG: hypothetical protein AB7F91_11800 [Parvularculaceae bacterium]